MPFCSQESPPYDCIIGGMADAAAGWSLQYRAKRSGSYYIEHNMLMVSNENNQVQVLSSDRWIESPNASSEMPPVRYKNETELRPFSDRERIELASRKCACSPDFVDWVPGGGTTILWVTLVRQGGCRLRVSAIMRKML